MVFESAFEDFVIMSSFHRKTSLNRESVIQSFYTKVCKQKLLIFNNMSLRLGSGRLRQLESRSVRISTSAIHAIISCAARRVYYMHISLSFFILEIKFMSVGHNTMVLSYNYFFASFTIHEGHTKRI